MTPMPTDRRDAGADPYPAGRVFVIKLHAAAHPAGGVCRGQLEHVLTGHQRPFATTAELLEALEGGQVDAPRTPGPGLQP